MEGAPFKLCFMRCTKCSKWRVIPTEKQYKEIREAMAEQPFSCEKAREWKPEISCEIEADITQDGSNPWGIDMPSAETPPGWERIEKIRNNRNSRLADVIYVSPSNETLRSLSGTRRYIKAHPEEGLNISQFCFNFAIRLVKKQAAEGSSTS